MSRRKRNAPRPDALLPEVLPAGALPPEQLVACSCDTALERLERPVFHDHQGWNTRVTACMRCGHVSVTEAMVEEPHPYDVRCVCNVVRALDAETLQWLSEWPRRIADPWGGTEWLLVAATTRCETADALGETKRRAETEQAGLLRLDRLLRAGLPRRAPPAGLPEGLDSYAHVHEAAFAPAHDLRSLFELFARARWAMSVYIDRLPSNPAFAPAVEAALREPSLQALALDLAGRAHLATPGVLAFLDATLRATTTETTLTRGALTLTGELGVRSLLGALDFAAGRIDQNKEYYFHKSIVDVAKRLRVGPNRE